jgi:hypothetical protein
VSDLMNIQPSYRCSIDGAATESAILAGNIANLSDNDLIQYAQHDCMLKPPPAGIAAYSVTAGTGTDCSSGTVTDSGSGTLNRRNTTGSCKRKIQGTYSLVYLGSHSSSDWIDVHNTSGGLTEVHATDISGSTAGIGAWDWSINGDSNSPVFFRLNSLSNGSEVYGSTANDTVSFTGNVNNGVIQTIAGNDTVILGGGATGYSTVVSLGDGDDTLYSKSWFAVGPFTTGIGKDRIYMGGVDSDMDFGAGDDIFSCTDVLGSGGCSTVVDTGSWPDLLGGTGNDIISVDGSFNVDSSAGGGSNIQGQAGKNIIYTKGVNSSNASYRVKIIASTSSGVGTGSLVVIGGNRIKGAISSSGSNNVLLLKSGTTSTNTTVCGAAFNDTQTSCANFARILWY